LSEIVVSKVNTVSKRTCVRQLAIVTLLLLLERFRRGCQPTEENKKGCWYTILTSDSMGSEGIRD